MVISDERYAAAFSNEQGEFFKFDDIGCMKRYEEENKMIPKYEWVHDHESHAWVEVSKAFFVHSIQLGTPMGYGIVAFSNRASAEKLSSTQEGQLITWDQIPKFFQNNTAFIQGGKNEGN